MALASTLKADLVKKFATHKGDTGSPEVQVALLSANISSLTDHLKVHKKDFHSRRGLVGMVNRRRTLLDYLKRKALNRYNVLIQELGLRK